MDHSIFIQEFKQWKRTFGEDAYVENCTIFVTQKQTFIHGIFFVLS